MAEKVEVRVLSCGQGATNWIEYYKREDDALPSGLGLVDLGGSAPRGSKAVDFIVQRLQKLHDVGKPAKIDICVFSHQDSDHWNLIGEFLEQLETKAIDLKTGEVWKSGTRWRKNATAAVDRLAARSDSGKVMRMMASYTG